MAVQEAAAHTAAAPMVEHMVVDREQVIHLEQVDRLVDSMAAIPTIMQAQDDNPKVRAAGNFISNGYYNEALKVLEEVPFAERRGRWYYYSAIANQKLGNTATAIEHIQRAVSLEPNNMQYRQFMQIIENGGSWYSDMGDIYGRPSGRGSECCSLLATFLCWQLFCC